MYSYLKILLTFIRPKKWQVFYFHNVLMFLNSSHVECLNEFSAHLSNNKRNGKHFNNRVYSLFFIKSIFLKHLWLIPNILEWQDCKIFTKLVLLQTPSRNSHWRCSAKNGALKNLWNFTGKNLCWSLFLIKLQTFRPVTLLRRDSNTGFFVWNLRSF